MLLYTFYPTTEKCYKNVFAGAYTQKNPNESFDSFEP